jgi:hypothetical protein
MEWHQGTIALLREYDRQHPGRILVKLMPMGLRECDDEMLKRGFTSAVIFINGEHAFALPGGRKVDLVRRPNDPDASTYNREDVIAILDGMK